MSIFKRRHYNEIARSMQASALDALWSEDAHIARENIINALIRMFRNDNNRFDAERFRWACQPGANVSARSPDKMGNLEAK
jgi:hypothetical protein